MAFEFVTLILCVVAAAGSGICRPLCDTLACPLDSQANVRGASPTNPIA